MNNKITQNSTSNIWVRRECLSLENIETCNGVAHKDTSTDTCCLCVAANHTVYREHNKCEFTHPHCKCAYTPYNFSFAKVIFSVEKALYFLTDNSKKGLAHKMGFYEEDAEYLHKTLFAIVKNQYEQGNYILGDLDTHGQHCKINTTIIGKRNHENELFNCYIGCVIWPNGQIRVATPLLCYDF